MTADFSRQLGRGRSEDHARCRRIEAIQQPKAAALGRFIDRPLEELALHEVRCRDERARLLAREIWMREDSSWFVECGQTIGVVLQERYATAQRNRFPEAG